MASAQTIRLRTADGCELTADLAEADGPVRGGVVVCHPHPLYGGNRHNPVVDAVFTALPAAGFRALRFDFRSVHDSDRFGGGVAESADVVAALDRLADDHPDLPLFLVGYSFGAALSLATLDGRVGAIVAIAPPLGAMPIERVPTVPVLVLSPRHDQYCPPDTAAPIVATWPRAELEPVESADHFLAGHTAAVARRAVTWLAGRAS
jgi:alpha/beta superfamily hydrolase